MEATGRLAAGVAHDANNILAALAGYAEMLREEVSDSPAAQRHLAGIDRSIDRADEMVAHLLAFTRGQHLQASEVDLAAVVQDLEDILRRLLPSGVDLTLDTRAAPALTDPAQVRQVVLNLVVNAREGVQGSGLVQVMTGVVELADDEYLDDGSYACLSVFDNGRGMEETVAERCFEPFFSTRVARGGTGLGLSTAHGIARQSGGDLRVRTAPGEGAEFQLLLPLPVAAGATSPMPPSPSGHAAGRVILLAEDDPDVRAVVAAMLRSHGHRVVEAVDGRAALAARVRPDLLVTDLEMPNLGGRELAAALRQRRPDLPVLFISGGTAPPELRPLLTKPFSPEELLAALAGALTRSGS
jgi:CheY-like chemotaxis protein